MIKLNFSSLDTKIIHVKTLFCFAEKNLSLNFSAMLIIPIILLVAMGNVLVILAVAIEKNLRSATNCFLSSLAVADLLVALMVMPPSLAMIINSKLGLFIALVF